jgi:hypothetical protein
MVDKDEISGVKVVISIAALMCVVVAIFFAWPVYKVWQQGLEGEASLRRAEQTRKIQIEQAKAEEESAKHRANAIKIVGQAAKDFPEYRYQEFLGSFADALHNGNVQKIIFVPTEAQIPITESGRSVFK